jgi:hypothetical protein
MKPTACPMPLYHGTSSLFVEDIKKYGLGGKNIIQEAKVLDFARAIHPFVKEHLQKKNVYDGRFDVFSDMVEQKSLYQHGQVYVSLSYDYCTKFTQIRKFGSELITYALSYYEDLLNQEILSIDFLKDYPFLRNIRNMNFNPVVIKIEKLDFGNLLCVNGEPLTDEYFEKIKMISDMEESKIKEFARSSYRFRLKYPISCDKLSFDFNPSLKYQNLS